MSLNHLDAGTTVADEHGRKAEKYGNSARMSFHKNAPYKLSILRAVRSIVRYQIETQVYPNRHQAIDCLLIQRIPNRYQCDSFSIEHFISTQALFLPEQEGCSIKESLQE